ncbi:MAG: hypothetical protein GX774_10035 [Armatimonadetes bacterium]|jgi:hypothetical protein|nr:hypothetical protein [Armatimonadota bacterium]
MRYRMLAAAGLALAMALSVAQAAPQTKSGLPVGNDLPAFDVVDLTGPNKDQSLCYV